MWRLQFRTLSLNFWEFNMYWVHDKKNSWSSKSLSQAGRETRIKSVLQAIPSYIMSIFSIPKSIIVDINVEFFLVGA